MANHYHLVVLAANEWRSDRILSDFKAYATRKLSGLYDPPASGTWWTGNGSKRPLRDERAIRSAVNYVLHKQPNPLVVWSSAAGRLV